MDLAQALRFNKVQSIAFVGAGGKTTALFRLAQQIPSPVLVTTTTHFAKWELSLADHHIQISSWDDIRQVENLVPCDGVIVLSGPESEPERVTGIDTIFLEKIELFARAAHIPLLIEADGSRQRPLKAPGSHEPVIPEFVDQVVVVAGLAALEKPLNDEWVHRPESFARISGLSIGDTISIDALVNVLIHPAGGVKNIPKNARVVALLNQADILDLQAVGQVLGEKLLPSFQSVVVASLKNKESKINQRRGIGDQIQTESDSDEGVIFSVHERVAAIILAAGGSSRLGKPKQLLPWQNNTFIEQVISIATDSGLWPIVVVTGAYSDQVKKEIQHLPVQIVYNRNWEKGQSTSVRRGLDDLPPDVGAGVFLLVDQPQISPQLIRKLVESHASTLSPIVAPIIDQQRGNPVLFDKITFPELRNLEGDVGGRALFSHYSPQWVAWHDAYMLRDVDTFEDYRRLLNNQDSD